MLLLSLTSVPHRYGTNFVRYSINRAPHMVIKKIEICGFWKLDYKGDVLTEIFSQQRLGCPARVEYQKVQLSDVSWAPLVV